MILRGKIGRIRMVFDLQTVLICMIIIPFLIPTLFLYVNIWGLSGSLVFNVLKVISLLLWGYFLWDKKFHISYLKEGSFLLIFLYGAFKSISSMINTRSLFEIVSMTAFIGFAYMCTDFIKRRAFQFVDTLVMLLTIYNVIQIVTVILYYPDGILENNGAFWAMRLATAKYFFGAKNQITNYMLLFLMTVSIRHWSVKTTFPMRVYLYWFLFFVEATVLSSAATQICLLIFLLFFLAIHLKLYRKNWWIFNPYFVLGFSLLFFVLTCLLGYSSNSLIIKYILGLFGRSSTFTNRIHIWREAISLFKGSPIFGIGERSFFIMGTEISQAHCAYIDILYKYGIISAVCFIGIFVSEAKCLYQVKKYSIGVVCIAVFFVMMIHNCVEPIDNYIVILTACLFGNLNYLVKRTKVKK